MILYFVTHTLECTTYMMNLSLYISFYNYYFETFLIG
jgi:hypothetical protein